ncbi:MAG: M23 family metallopeptidase [Clostridia bacterium]|nr:M23 family metallopeptidase [Clostridia bacterium]
MKQLKDLFYDIVRWFSALNIKKTAFIVSVAALIITPTVLAGGYVIYNEYVHNTDYFSVTLYDSDENIIAEERETPENAKVSTLTEIFYTLTKDPVAYSADTTANTDRTFVRAVMSYNGSSSEIICYFSTDEASAYYTDESGKSFAIPESINTEFLSTPYSEVFYPSSTALSLSTIDLDVITPRSVDWYYKNTSGDYMLSTRNKRTDKLKTYEITGAIDIKFESEPDLTVARVYDGDDLIYRGAADELPFLIADANDKLRIHLEAEWNKSSDAENYGKQVYEFYVSIKNRSNFYLSSEKAQAGGFVILDCTNVTDLSKIGFSCNRDGYSPVFRYYNDLARTLIQFPVDSAEELFEFTVTYGAAAQSFSVEITRPSETAEFTFSSLLFEDGDVPILRNGSIMNEISGASLPPNELVYFRGNFSAPEKHGYTAAYTHNSKIVWGEALEYSYTAIGNEYVTVSNDVSGSSVKALQNGIVAYIGYNDWLGNYVVIDHGCGLRTWYAGLGKIDVEVGELLLCDQHIGKAGEGTFNGSEGFTLYCTLYDAVIDPNALFDLSSK